MGIIRRYRHIKYWPLRRGIQILSLAFFVYLLFYIGRVLPHDLYFRLDPLTGISAMLGERRWLPEFAWGLIVLALAVLGGRVWCGWLCPLGTLLDAVPARKNNTYKPEVPEAWRKVKYYLLTGTVLLVAVGGGALLILDPVTILYRTFTAFIPLERNVIATETGYTVFNIMSAVILAAILILNAVRMRFWCRYLCPLGGLLGLVSKLAFRQHWVKESVCQSCHRCMTYCPTGTIQQSRRYASDPDECISCLICKDVCPAKAAQFSRKPKLNAK
uniref:4Fe-4S binding protein n=1 Tax=uncultured Dehalococcoidia bacterium TaxID=498747 RepID=A0A871XYJ7_9CHLR|nr:4Fe-4S binding protein [uncultured Dehalococcoidia bacterium]